MKNKLLILIPFLLGAHFAMAGLTAQRQRQLNSTIRNFNESDLQKDYKVRLKKDVRMTNLGWRSDAPFIKNHLETTLYAETTDNSISEDVNGGITGTGKCIFRANLREFYPNETSWDSLVESDLFLQRGLEWVLKYERSPKDSQSAVGTSVRTSSPRTTIVPRYFSLVTGDKKMMSIFCEAVVDCEANPNHCMNLSVIYTKRTLSKIFSGLPEDRIFISNSAPR